MSGRGAGLLGFAVAIFGGAGATAAPFELNDGGGQRQVLYFVPELLGAATLDLALTNRFDGFVDGYALGLPEVGGDVALGWRHYLDPWGQASLGLNVGLAFQVARDERRPTVYHPRLGFGGRLRGLSEEFMSFALGVYAEAGPVLLEGGLPPPDFPELAGEASGLAWSVGIETGPGRLFFLSPYVFGELTARIGLESVLVGGVSVQSLTGGLRLGFDWAVLDPTPSEPPDEPRPVRGSGVPTGPD